MVAWAGFDSRRRCKPTQNGRAKEDIVSVSLEEDINEILSLASEIADAVAGVQDDDPAAIIEDDYESAVDIINKADILAFLLNKHGEAILSMLKKAK